MSRCYEISCNYCGGSIFERENWDNIAHFHRECAWSTENCEMCGGEMKIHRGWTDAPKTHIECTDTGWYENACNICGNAMKLHRDWNNPPNSHKECISANWYEHPCDICGGPMRLHREWSDPPKSHMQCMAAKWYEKECKYCESPLSVHVDWENPPEYHKECEWFEKPCEICRKDMTISRTWLEEPRSHEKCIEQFAPKEVSCAQCGEFFKLSTAAQFKCFENGRDLPTECRECRHDALLITGAVGALRQRLAVPLETATEQRDQIITDNVTVVRNLETQEVVAEVKMAPEGIFSVNRVAVTYDPKSKENILKTEYGKEGFFLPKRTADTYDRDGILIHRTKMVEKSVLLSKNGGTTNGKEHTNGTAAIKKYRFFFPAKLVETE